MSESTIPISLDDSMATVSPGFDSSIFQQHLQTKWLGRPLHVFDELESTNTQLWQLLKGGAQTGTAVLGLQQQAGRGQRGRTWMSQPGGLYLSVAVQPDLNADESAQLTLCSALGVAMAFQSLRIPVGLKWPNDLLLQSKKLGGILTETVIQDGKIDWAVIGIGINWRNPVPEEGISLTAYAADHPPDPIQSLEHLSAIALQGIETGYTRWQKTGIVGILPDYLQLLWAMSANTETIQLSRELSLQFKVMTSSESEHSG